MDKIKAICALIDYSIRTDFRDKLHAKLKKGIVHDQVCKRLRVKLSPYLRSLINSRMEKAGYMTVIRRGKYFFNHIEVAGG